jgi:hypothetical protein
MAGNISDSRGGYDGKVRSTHIKSRGRYYLLTIRIKTISLSVIAKFKAENPDFDIDFESFVKELSTDDAVFISCGGDI